MSCPRESHRKPHASHLQANCKPTGRHPQATYMRPSSHLPATFKPGKGEAHNCGAGEAFETLWLNSDESRRTHGSCGIRAPDRHRGFGIARIAGPRVRSFDMQQFVISHSRREFIRQLAGAGIMISALPPGRRLFGAEARHLPEAALTFPGPWAFSVPKGGIILVSDQQLEDLQDPDKEVDLSLSKTPNVTTLRKVCEGAKAQGARTVILAFDEFWSQYRKGQGGKPRQLLPDTEAYIQRLAKISQTLKQYGLGLELSLLSPLEIGRGYEQKTGESGRWVQYREGFRDPATGRYTVSLWEQQQWTNNKGTIELRRTGVRVFAFREHRMGGSSFYRVDPAGIVELKSRPEVDVDESAQPSTRARRLTVRGQGETQVGALDRVLVVVSYATPEMDSSALRRDRSSRGWWNSIMLRACR